MKKAVVLVAGGSGIRMGTALPKQFMLIHDKPVFIHSIEAFLNSFSDINIILVLPETYITYAEELIAKSGVPNQKIKIVAGGPTRFDSVKNGLSIVPNEQVVFIHDAVRCLISRKLIQRCAEACILEGSAIPVLPLRDSIREVLIDGSSISIDRSKLRIVQTPQVFLSSKIKPAFDQDYRESFTDEATVFESAGYRINLVEGEESNIKITYPADIDFAKWKLLQKDDLK